MPVDGESAIERTLPVGGYSVKGTKSGEKVFGVVVVDVFNSKVVDD